MFWRSIPRATDVLARPDNDNLPPRPPRPARPPRPNELVARPAERDGSASEDDDLPPTSRAAARPVRSSSRPATFRQAVQEVIDDERARHHPHETMGDVVLAAMGQEDPKGGLARLVARRKSVVGLFRKGDGRVQPDELEGGAGLNGRRARGGSSEDDESDGVDVEHASPSVAPPRPRPLPPPLAPAPPLPTPYRSTTLVAQHQETSRPPRRPSPARRSTFIAQARDPPHRGGSTARLPPACRPASPARLSGTDPYHNILERSAYRDVDEDLSSEASSIRSSSPSPSSGSARSSLEEVPSFAVRPPPTSTYTGLVNLGNTCYLSAVLQALVATDALAHFFSNDDYRDEINTTSRLGLRGALAKSFARLVQVIRGGEYRSASPVQLRDTIGRLSDRFLEPTQQDAHEVLLTLLDGLHEDLNLVVDPPPPRTVSPEREAQLERLPEVVAADQEWEQYRVRNDSIVIDLFQGFMRNRMECMHCQTTSTTFSPLQTLSLSIPEPRSPRRAVSLSQCIDSFLAEEILHGENAWHCPSCRTLRSTSKRFSVARLPQILIIHLKRFDPLSHKLTTRVALPLGPLPLGHLLPPLALDSPYRLNAPHAPDTTYELFATVNHLGEDGSGHYTTLLREPTSPSAHPAAPPTFVLLDDETVDRLSSPSAQAAALRDAETTAYLLFFRLGR
ncbi:hypothetical protein JCM8208_005624 [Rhodotorula glutinis]